MNPIKVALLAFLAIFAIILLLATHRPAIAAECEGEMVKASWYGTESGSRTANGEPFDGTSITAAHRTLPFGTKRRVTLDGKSVVVRINDRGPFIAGRGLDLSRAAAERIGLIREGVAWVCMTPA
jgi:rare lipoprotein A